MGRNRQQELDRAIEDVAHGRRDLASIRDAEVREAVRLALRLHETATQTPDAYTRLRMRARVLAGLDPRRPGLREHAWTALALLGRPAPYLARGLALAALLVSAGLGATAASADTLPDELLYPVKIASEEIRLALAGTPEDRAAVELSIAEHRLREAERLATGGRTSDALVASAIYSQHIASAAAELAPIAATSDLALQLEARFASQRGRALTLASTLATNTRSAAASRVLALIAAPTIAPGVTGVQRVADTAASVAAQLADVAERTVADAAPADAPGAAAAGAGSGAAGAPRQSASATATARASSAATQGQAAISGLASTPTPERAAADTATPKARAVATPRPTDTPDPHASEAAKTARRAAEQARAAADRVRQHAPDRDADRRGDERERDERERDGRTGRGNGR
ncbi:MAG TPA: DUF5667 domain-containing protein [Candidatus Limnocylindria bacterium]|nr:DUF5667 domain-containing protein [Candidatus Limnocylindria bacterium]